MLLQTLFFYIPCSSQTLPNGQQLEYNPVLTAVPFLTITPDARHSAMGDAGAATTADANAQYWNGAKGIFAESTYGVSFSYAPWLTQLVKGINLSCLSGYYKLNANEVIAHVASTASTLAIHPNDHVNLGQSSNDTIPTSIRVMAALESAG